MNYEKQNNILIGRYLAGDSAAGDELIIRNRPLVKATVKHMLAGWPSHNYLRDDLRSEGLLALTKVVRKLEEPPSSFRNLVITAVRNAVFKIFTERDESDYGAHVHFGANNASNPSLAVDCASLKQYEDRDFLLAQCRGGTERAVLELYFERHTLQEIAGQLQMTRITVRRALKRIRERVRNAYAELS